MLPVLRSSFAISISELFIETDFTRRTWLFSKMNLKNAYIKVYCTTLEKYGRVIEHCFMKIEILIFIFTKVTEILSHPCEERRQTFRC